jgi:serine/threonine-protein kinase
MRLAIFNFAAFMIDWALEGRHVPSVEEYALFIQGLGRALFVATLSWLIYVALEPLIRRRWPDSLIAWTRLLSGRFTDPLVGRTLLAGALLGVFQGVMREVMELAERALEPAPPIPSFPWDLTLLGPRAVAGHLAAGWAVTMLIATGLALIFFLLKAVLRKEWLAAAVFLPLFAWLLSEGGWIPFGFGLVVSAAFIFVFLRFGLLALVFANYYTHFLQFPLTTDSSAWYAGTSLFLLLVLAAIAIYGFRIALAGRPAFSGTGLDD